MKDNTDHFNVLRKIQKNPKSSQRELAEKLGFSLGKLNYSLKALKSKDLIKISNFKENPNKFMSLDQSMFQRAGGDPNIFYLHGYWSLQEEQGLLIKTDIPECEYWNFQLNNFWMESLDYRYFDICVNNGNAKLETDGSLVILIASSNPGVKNWIDTSHHLSGTMLLRWVNAISHPLPETQVIQLKDYLSE